MPADALWAVIGKRRRAIGWGELFELKQLFGASVQAITYRCKDLGIFSAATFRRLFNEFEQARVAQAAIQGTACEAGRGGTEAF